MPANQHVATKISAVQPIGVLRFSFAKSVWIAGALLIGVGWGIPALTWQLGLLTGFLTIATVCLGHSVGLHRGLIHQSYNSGSILRVTLLYLDALSGLGGPLTWTQIHAQRDYWQNRKDCPDFYAYRHSLMRDYVWNIHFHFAPHHPPRELELPDRLLMDPWMRFFQWSWPVHLATLALLLWWLVGLDAVFVGIFLRSAIAILGHWFVGYAAHRWGQAPYQFRGVTEGGTNQWLLGVLTFGEGFHNNHHAYPQSARMGFHRSQFDLSWQVIRLFARLGWIDNVQAWPLSRPSVHLIVADANAPSALE